MVSAVRHGLSAALVHYYPLAGRLREVDGRKLVVDCTGEGVLLVEADAEVCLWELEAAVLRPPFPYMDKLLFQTETEASSGVLNCPLLVIQVTRLLCGGFVFAFNYNHTMCDGIGLAQFLNAVAELARGVPAVSVTPTWSRELLNARIVIPPQHRGGQEAAAATALVGLGDMVMQSFTFSPADVATMKKHLPPAPAPVPTTFETIAVFLWRARTMALQIPLGQDALLLIMANLRRAADMGLPAGYYGNACVACTAMTKVAALYCGSSSSLAHLLGLVRKAKAAVTSSDESAIRSMVDQTVVRGQPYLLPLANNFLLTDLRHAGFHGVNFGWGDPVFAGPTSSYFGVSPIMAMNEQEEEAVVVPVVLPQSAMERFAAEMQRLCMPAASKL